MNILKNLSPRRFALLVTVLYSIVALAGVLHHAMWRDELEAWMIANNAHNLKGLFANMRYQGHPALWHLCLFLISRVTDNPFSMQVFHLAIAVLIVYIFSRYSPFSNLQKILFASGYYVLFEYSIVSRNYGIGVLLLFLICINKDSNRFLLAVLIGLLANTNVYMAIVAGGLFLSFFIYPLFKNEGWIKPGGIMLQIVIIIIFFILAIIQILPPEDGGVMKLSTAFDFSKLQRVTGSIFTAFFAIPRPPGRHFWETLLFIDSNIMDVLAVLIYTFTLLFIVRDIKWRIFLLSTLILITAFNYVGYGYSARHLGTYVFAWIAAVWFSKTQSAPLPEHKSVRYLLNGIFVCQAIAGIYAYVMTMAYPFSSGKEIAGFIEQKKWNSENIVGYQDFTASTVAGYLNRPIYYPERHQSATFMVWNKEKKWGLENRDLENELIHSMELNPGKRTLLITNSLLTMKFEVLDYTLLKDSREPIVGDEWLRLYEIKHR